MVDKMNLKKIELYMDKIIQNEEIEDAMDWLLDLGTLKKTGNELLDIYSTDMEQYSVLLLTQLADEKYEFCAKIRDVIEITTKDMERLIKMKNVDEDEKQELLMELRFIYDLYRLSVVKVLEDVDED
jgi:hypothetical protein